MNRRAAYRQRSAWCYRHGLTFWRMSASGRTFFGRTIAEAERKARRDEVSP